MGCAEILRLEFNRIRAIELARLKRENAALRALIAVLRAKFRLEYKKASHDYTLCGVPGCGTMTRGTFCQRHCQEQRRLRERTITE